MQEVYNLLNRLINEFQSNVNIDLNGLISSIENINGLIRELDQKARSIQGNIAEYEVNDLIDEKLIFNAEEEITKACTKVLSRDIIKRRSITNEITYEVHKPLSAYEHIALLRETVSNIKKDDSQPGIIREVFNFCTSLTDRLFLFLERKAEQNFAGYDGFIRDKATSEAKSIVKQIKIPFDEEGILMEIYKNKAPFIGQVTKEDSGVLNKLGFSDGDEISVFPLMLKGVPAALFVFDGNIWPYMYILDVLLITAELKMELTFAKRKVEPHYPPIDIESYLETSKRLEKRTILKQDRSEKEEPAEYGEYTSSDPDEAEDLYRERSFEPEPESEPGTDADAEVEAESEGEFTEEEEKIDDSEVEFIDDEKDGTEEEEALIADEEELDTEFKSVEAEEEEETERETEQIILPDIEEKETENEQGQEEEDEREYESYIDKDEFDLEEGTELLADRKGEDRDRESTDEFAIQKEDDEFDEEILEEDNFDYGKDDEGHERNEPEVVSAEEYEPEGADFDASGSEEEERAASEESEYSEEDMDFDEEEIEGQLDEELGPLPDDMKEKPEPEEAVAAEPVLSDEEQSLFEDARRFARLVVSEIKLYHEEDVKKGRINKNLYQLLKVDIDRGRAMYDGRVNEIVKRSRDFYHESLVDILAAGDEGALGL